MLHFRLLVRGVVLATVLAATACRPAPKPETNGKPQFAVTIAPLGAYLSPIVAGRAEVHVLLPPGASPHTYEIKPADARAAAMAAMMVYIDDSLDGWAFNLRTETPTSYRFIDSLPAEQLLRFGENSPDGHHHGTLDPHVWLNPDLMRAGLMRTVGALSLADPDGAAVYQSNAEKFSIELEQLDKELAATLAPLKGQAVIQFHPALYYMFDRYGIRTAGVIENIAGQEPSPKQIKELADLVKSENVRVIVTEPQLPDAPVQALAEATGAHIARMDPLGGVPGRTTYTEILRYNANALLEAFK